MPSVHRPGRTNSNGTASAAAVAAAMAKAVAEIPNASANARTIAAPRSTYPEPCHDAPDPRVADVEIPEATKRRPERRRRNAQVQMPGQCETGQRLQREHARPGDAREAHDRLVQHERVGRSLHDEAHRQAGLTSCFPCEPPPRLRAPQHFDHQRRHEEAGGRGTQRLAQHRTWPQQHDGHERRGDDDDVGARHRGEPATPCAPPRSVADEQQREAHRADQTREWDGPAGTLGRRRSYYQQRREWQPEQTGMRPEHEGDQRQRRTPPRLLRHATRCDP